VTARYGNRYPGSGTVNPFAGGPDWYPLKNVRWEPRTEEVEVETCEKVRIRIPADNFGHWLKQAFGNQPKYREEILCRVETQMHQTGWIKHYDR
jgi:hypothetical protein